MLCPPMTLLLPSAVAAGAAVPSTFASVTLPLRSLCLPGDTDLDVPSLPLPPSLGLTAGSPEACRLSMSTTLFPTLARISFGTTTPSFSSNSSAPAPTASCTRLPPELPAFSWWFIFIIRDSRHPPGPLVSGRWWPAPTEFQGSNTRLRLGSAARRTGLGGGGMLPGFAAVWRWMDVCRRLLTEEM